MANQFDEKEEKFEDLLDEYWDDEEVNAKINEDTKEEALLAYGDSRKDSPFDEVDEIYISDYVNKFLGIKGDFTNFRHFELKNLNCPYVIGVANEYADKNPEFVTQKKYLLIVIDRNGKRGTYINPVIAHEYVRYDEETAKKTLSKRMFGFEELEEFFREYAKVQSEHKAYLEFIRLLEETKKTIKFSRISNYEEKLGDEENDKHKGK